MKKKSNKEKGQKFERKVEKTINSGALSFDKGDLKSDEYVIEVKFTEKKGYRLTTKVIKKIWEEALEANKLPLLIIGIDDETNQCLWRLKIDIERERK